MQPRMSLRDLQKYTIVLLLVVVEDRTRKRWDKGPLTATAGGADRILANQPETNRLEVNAGGVICQPSRIRARLQSSSLPGVPRPKRRM